MKTRKALIHSWGVKASTVRELIQLRTKARCPHCGKRLYTSDVKGYKYVCFHCDENFYGIEVR